MSHVIAKRRVQLEQRVEQALAQLAANKSQQQEQFTNNKGRGGPVLSEKEAQLMLQKVRVCKINGQLQC